jgi:hypothetical protein
LFFSANVLSWNAIGHRVVALIAFDQMTPQAKKIFSEYNNAMNKVYKPQNWADAAVWLDTLRYQDIRWFVTMHYVDLPFSEDGSALPPPNEINAIGAIENAKQVLLNKYATNFDKGMALRVLMHVVGDLHQPLHAASRISQQLPNGDRGGNLVPLQDNALGKNLHTYWDKGGGFLIGKNYYQPALLEEKAKIIEKNWPCKSFHLTTSPASWAKESHLLAVKYAYHFPINAEYQLNTQKISEKQISLAGCRLGELLNTIENSISTKRMAKMKIRHRRPHARAS